MGEASVPVRGRRSVWVVAGAIAVLVALIGAFATQFRSPTSSSTESTSSTDAALPGVAGELQELLARDRRATFHATYDVSSTDLPGAAVTFETWRRAPRTRTDIDVRKPDGVVHTRQLQLPDRTVACQSSGDGPWQCAQVPKAAGSASDPFGAAVADELAKARSVTVRNRVIGGRRVRCFTLARDGQTALFCATREGIPVRVESPGATLQLLALDHEVGDVFDPPTEVQ